MEAKDTPASYWHCLHLPCLHVRLYAAMRVSFSKPGKLSDMAVVLGQASSHVYNRKKAATVTKMHLLDVQFILCEESVALSRFLGSTHTAFQFSPACSFFGCQGDM